MQRLEVSGAVRLIYRSLGVEGLRVPSHFKRSLPICHFSSAFATSDTLVLSAAVLFCSGGGILENVNQASGCRSYNVRFESYKCLSSVLKPNMTVNTKGCVLAMRLSCGSRQWAHSGPEIASRWNCNCNGARNGFTGPWGHDDEVTEGRKTLQWINLKHTTGCCFEDGR